MSASHLVWCKLKLSRLVVVVVVVGVTMTVVLAVIFTNLETMVRGGCELKLNCAGPLHCHLLYTNITQSDLRPSQLRPPGHG